MAAFKLTVDTSVVVKWLNQQGEANTEEAISLLEKAKKGELLLISSDLLPIETVNALIWSKKLQTKLLEEAIHDLFSFPIELVITDKKLAVEAGKIAKKHDITMYDAIYLAVAYSQNAPLITANPKDQARFKKIPVFNLADWPISDEEIEIYTDDRLKELLEEDRKF